MIVLSKKRFGIISAVLLVSVFVFVFQIANSDKTVQTVSLPVSNKVIVLDAGHGKPDEGAQSSNGTTEAETNLKITLKVQSLLEQSGATVILTRSDENAIYDLDKNSLRQKKIGQRNPSATTFSFRKSGAIWKCRITSCILPWTTPRTCWRSSRRGSWTL